MVAEPNHAAPVAPSRERKSVQFLLRAGLGLAVLLMTAGLAAELLRGQLSGEPFQLRELAASTAPPGQRLMGLGILVLALTPAVRVLALLVLWSQERDWRFVAVALAVIATLGAAMALGG